MGKDRREGNERLACQMRSLCKNDLEELSVLSLEYSMPLDEIREVYLEMLTKTMNSYERTLASYMMGVIR